MTARILVVDDSPTLRRLLSAVLSRHGFEVEVAADGHEALAKLAARGSDLVVLDFVMPGMDGYQVCRAMRADPKLRETPVVVVSALADRVRGQFLTSTGAIDAISKPFDPATLVAVVEGALARVEQGRARPGPPASEMPAEWAAVPSSRHVSRDDPAVQRARAGRALARAFADAVSERIAALPPASARDASAIGAAIGEALTPERTELLAARVKAIDLGDGARDVLSADVAAISLAELLQVLHYERQTGLVTVTSRSGEVVIAMREGVVDLALSRGLAADHRLGRKLVEQGATAQPDVDRVSSLRAEATKRLIGETLVRYGMVSAEQVRAALEQQTQELVYEALRFGSGKMVFSRNATRPEAEAARLGLAVAPLVMEAFRRVDEWKRIEAELPFDRVLVRRPGGAPASLSAVGRKVLAAVDGRRTVREVVAAVDASAFEVSRILRELLEERLVAERRA